MLKKDASIKIEKNKHSFASEVKISLKIQLFSLTDVNADI